MSKTVPFVFCYVRRAPRDQLELRKQYTIKAQSDIIHRSANVLKLELLPAYIGYATNRSKAFTLTPDWNSAVFFARRSSASIIVDIPTLFERTPPGVMTKIVDHIESAPVLILDASSGRHWHEMSTIDKKALRYEAAREFQRRSSVIKEGIDASESFRKQSQPKNQQSASMQRSRETKRRAEALRPVVAELEAKNPDGTLSPSHVAREFNKRSILSPQGKGWSYNSAKNLLLRLGYYQQDETG